MLGRGFYWAEDADGTGVCIEAAITSVSNVSSVMSIIFLLLGMMAGFSRIYRGTAPFCQTTRQTFIKNVKKL